MMIQNQAQWKAERTLEWDSMLAELEQMAVKQDQWAAEHAKHTERNTTGLRLNIYKMVDPIQYCSSGKELDRFLNTWRSNSNSHGHRIWCGGPDHLNYMITLLHSWSNHQYLALRQTAMTEHSDWAGIISPESDSCILDVDQLSQVLAKTVGDKDQCHMMVIRLMQENIQPQQESVWAYSNHLKVNCWQVRWNLQHHEVVLDDVGWAGLCTSLTNIVKLMKAASSWYYTIDELFEKSAPSEDTHVENKMPPVGTMLFCYRQPTLSHMAYSNLP